MGGDRGLITSQFNRSLWGCRGHEVGENPGGERKDEARAEHGLFVSILDIALGYVYRGSLPM